MEYSFVVDELNRPVSEYWIHVVKLARRSISNELPATVLSFRRITRGWLGSRVVSVLDSGAEGPGFKSHSRRCRVTVLGKLFTAIVPLFTKQQNW